MVASRRLFMLAFVCCGARTELRGEPIDASTPIEDVAHVDVVHADVVHADVVQDDVQPGPCTLGPFIDMQTNECFGDQQDWFATPYTPPATIHVDTMEAFMTHGNVALLTSVNGMPGAVLFEGNLGTSGTKTWLSTAVSPAVTLSAGTQYFIGFQGDCSFSQGGTEPVEYMAPSVNGPWHNQGTDNWTARLIGTCE
jgi:hypothetical protein